MSTNTNYKAYLASGWFSDSQEQARQEIMGKLRELGISFFSPKDDNLGPQDANLSLQERVLKANCQAIDQSQFVVASLTGFDMGTTWEIGYALANRIPIIIYADLITLSKVEPCLRVLKYATSPKELELAIAQL